MIRTFGGVTPTIDPQAYVDDAAILIGKVSVGARSSIWPGAVLRGDIEPVSVGEGSSVQEGTIVHTDAGCPAIIGNRVTVGHAAVIHGCSIGDDALIGIGAIILSGAKIGAGAVVAAGALVPEGAVVEPGMLVMGAPAKPRREVSAVEMERFRKNAERYADRSQDYLAESKNWSK